MNPFWGRHSIKTVKTISYKVFIRLLIEMFGRFKSKDIKDAGQRKEVPGPLKPEDLGEEFKTDSRRDRD